MGKKKLELIPRGIVDDFESKVQEIWVRLNAAAWLVERNSQLLISCEEMEKKQERTPDGSLLDTTFVSPGEGFALILTDIAHTLRRAQKEFSQAKEKEALNNG